MYAIHGGQASWDPTGTSIIYLDDLGTSVHRLVPGGTDVVLLKSYWQIRDAALSPDGKRLAYTRLVTSTNPEIFVLDLATKSSKRLTYNGAQDLHVTWSPDGTRLAFLSNRSGPYQVWSMNASTGAGSPRSPTWRMRRRRSGRTRATAGPGAILPGPAVRI